MPGLIEKRMALTDRLNLIGIVMHWYKVGNLEKNEFLIPNWLSMDRLGIDCSICEDVILK